MWHRNTAGTEGQERIDLVINSHSHVDHSAGNWVFEGVPIWVPEEEFAFNGNMMALSLRYADEDSQEEFRSLLKNNMGFKDARPTNPYSDGFLFNLGRPSLKPYTHQDIPRDTTVFLRGKRGFFFHGT